MHCVHLNFILFARHYLHFSSTSVTPYSTKFSSCSIRYGYCYTFQLSVLGVVLQFLTVNLMPVIKNIKKKQSKITLVYGNALLLYSDLIAKYCEL